MLKMALFDCAINEKCCSVDGRRSISPLFSSPPLGIWQLKSPHPGNLPSKAKKNASAQGSAGGGGGLGAGGIDWYIKSVYVTVYNENSGESRKSEDSTAFRMFIQCLRGYFL